MLVSRTQSSGNGAQKPAVNVQRHWGGEHSPCRSRLVRCSAGRAPSTAASVGALQWNIACRSALIETACETSSGRWAACARTSPASSPTTSRSRCKKPAHHLGPAREAQGQGGDREELPAPGTPVWVVHALDGAARGSRCFEDQGQEQRWCRRGHDSLTRRAEQGAGHDHSGRCVNPPRGGVGRVLGAWPVLAQDGGWRRGPGRCLRAIAVVLEATQACREWHARCCCRFRVYLTNYLVPRIVGLRPTFKLLRRGDVWWLGLASCWKGYRCWEGSCCSGRLRETRESDRLEGQLPGHDGGNRCHQGGCNGAGRWNPAYGVGWMERAEVLRCPRTIKAEFRPRWSPASRPCIAAVISP